MARDLLVKLLGDATPFIKSMDQAENKASSWSTGVGKVAAVAGGLLAGAKILEFGRDAVAAFTESEQAQSKLTLALKNNPATVDINAKAFAEYNKQLAKHTLADDDVIAATEAQMATFGMSEKQIKGMIPVVMDYAAKVGIDAPAAADLLDKASMGNIKALKSLGIEGFKPTGDRGKDLAAVQVLVAAKTKGAAQAQLDAAGPGAKFNKSMDELKETVGSFLVPALQKLTSIGVAVTDFLANHPVVSKFALAIGVLAGGIWLVNAAMTAWDAITVATATAFWALDAALAANPIGLIALAVAAVIGVLIALYVKVDWFRDAVNAAFNAVWAVVGPILEKVGGAISWVADKLGIGGDAAKKHGDDVKDGADKAGSSIANYNTTAAKALEATNTAVTDNATKTKTWSDDVIDSIQKANDPMKAFAVDNKITLDQVQANLVNNAKVTEQWMVDLRTIIARGHPLLAAELMKMGPAAADAVDQASKASESRLSEMERLYISSGTRDGEGLVNAMVNGADRLLPALIAVGAKGAALFGSGWKAGIQGVVNDTNNILATVKPPSVSVSTSGSSTVIPARAAGGPINGLSLVGENGPELFAGTGTIIPNNKLGGGNSYSITVYAWDTRDGGEAAVKAIQDYERSNGSGWRN